MNGTVSLIAPILVNLWTAGSREVLSAPALRRPQSVPKYIASPQISGVESIMLPAGRVDSRRARQRDKRVNKPLGNFNGAREIHYCVLIQAFD
jgi:hypothetical protein